VKVFIAIMQNVFLGIDWQKHFGNLFSCAET